MIDGLKWTCEMSIVEFIYDIYHVMHLINHILKSKYVQAYSLIYALKYAHAVSYACLVNQINVWFNL